MIRVGFAGIPGSGKTSTARGFASACRGLKGLKNIELSAEYARRYIAKYGRIEAPWEQFRIMKKQMDWEDSTGKVDMVITDGPIFLCLMYAQMHATGSPKDTMSISDIFNELNKANNPRPRYDIIFYLPPILDPVRDGIRPESNFDAEWRAEADAKLRGVFQVFPPVGFCEVKADTLNDRITECLTVLHEYLGHRVIGELSSFKLRDGYWESSPSYQFYIEVDGIAHRSDARGNSRCEHAHGGANRNLPLGEQCPICFGGGSV